MIRFALLFCQKKDLSASVWEIFCLCYSKGMENTENKKGFHTFLLVGGVAIGCVLFLGVVVGALSIFFNASMEEKRADTELSFISLREDLQGVVGVSSVKSANASSMDGFTQPFLVVLTYDEVTFSADTIKHILLVLRAHNDFLNQYDYAMIWQKIDPNGQLVRLDVKAAAIEAGLSEYDVDGGGANIIIDSSNWR